MPEDFAMLQTHKNCTNPKCTTCMADHLAVGAVLDELTGNDMVDHMGRFHKWLSDQGIEPETEHGWATESFFDDDLIQRYVDDYKA